MSEGVYVKQKLLWVKERMEMLDKIDEKLQEMKQIAEFARDNLLSETELRESNIRINRLGNEVQAMYERDKNFCLDWQ